MWKLKLWECLWSLCKMFFAGNNLDSLNMLRPFLELYHTENVLPKVKSLAQSAVKNVCCCRESCDCVLCEAELSLCWKITYLNLRKPLINLLIRSLGFKLQAPRQHERTVWVFWLSFVSLLYCHICYTEYLSYCNYLFIFLMQDILGFFFYTVGILSWLCLDYLQNSAVDWMYKCNQHPTWICSYFQ